MASETQDMMAGIDVHIDSNVRWSQAVTSQIKWEYSLKKTSIRGGHMRYLGELHNE